MTDDIQKVREAYEAAAEEAIHSCGDGPRHGPFYMSAFFAALAKRLQPRSEPVKKVWSVSPGLADRYEERTAEESRKSIFVWYRRGRDEIIAILNAIAPDIILERPDLVKADVQRRLAAHLPSYRMLPDTWAKILRDIFPELEDSST